SKEDVASTSVQPAAPAETAPVAAAPVASTRKKADAKTSSAKSQKPAAAAVTNHKLKTGDNLSSLARKYGVTVDQIMKANNMTSDRLRAGETIKIPAKTQSNSSGISRKKSSKRRRR
ncbi:MAG: LysM peptidoglycan-binding domain-containing protein, partial [Paramuribaculum sp.]|nr:LysM peptidoglycan-binding domain-containing protein [Paramuribaculum sp.]